MGFKVMDEKCYKKRGTELEYCDYLYFSIAQQTRFNKERKEVFYDGGFVKSGAAEGISFF